MVSSTFTDLEGHRAALIHAIKGQGLTDVAMENDSAKPDVDVIDSSLQMVRDASAYIGVISRKYGQTPLCPERNPRNLSITELEFNEAQRLKRPILLFVMGDEHLVRESSFETDTAKREKLTAFRERAKQMKPNSPVHRVYATFNDLNEFVQKAIHAVAGLRRYLDQESAAFREHEAAPSNPAPTTAEPEPDPIPTPPTFYSEPRYIASHTFVGRQAQLDVLSDWADPADPHPILMFDAIGGTGKSMLTWEWTTKHATRVREDWAGRFWYSFYERGAIMSDFCQRALAYVTGKPIQGFRKKRTLELTESLLHHLQARPWLIVLDGLERVLVAYHRSDAAQLTDEEASEATDKIGHRDPCIAIRPEDDDLLRALAAAAPSKLLITSRLVPRVLLNPASQPIPGVLRILLPGLRPADAEALFRSCGITGASPAIQNYLKTHCDCHPLVTGVLAGLINDYLPNKGNFDAWVADPAGGGNLNLANLDLMQKRNHILRTALDALSEKSRQLLSSLALLSEAADYPVLSALNPHMPPEPEEVKEPARPEAGRGWEQLSEDEREQAKQQYQVISKRWMEYQLAVKARLRSDAFRAAPQELGKTVRDLEHRGLLQYDPNSKRYDLHPVVRSIAARGLRQEEKHQYGQRLVDHFSQQAHSPYQQAETLDDLRAGLHVVRGLLHVGRFRQAYDAFQGDLSRALLFNLEGYAETLSLLLPFYPDGWAKLPDLLSPTEGSYLAQRVALALRNTGAARDAIEVYNASLLTCLRHSNWVIVRSCLSNLATALTQANRLAKAELCLLLALDFADLDFDKESPFIARQTRFIQLAKAGRWAEAEAMLILRGPTIVGQPGRIGWQKRQRLFAGKTALALAQFHFWRGDLKEEDLAHAEQLVKLEKDRASIRSLHRLRGEWQLEQGHWELAAGSLRQAVRMARETGKSDKAAEAHLALAKFRLNQLHDLRLEAEQLSSARNPSHRALADLWLAQGDHERAQKHALAAYKWAWADGEPYVHRYELNKARALLEKLGVTVPNLPPYDPGKDEKLPWEEDVVAAIVKLRAEKNSPLARTIDTRT